jgi:hypothetical protein
MLAPDILADGASTSCRSNQRRREGLPPQLFLEFLQFLFPLPRSGRPGSHARHRNGR